jgi:hypothetical protein
MGVVVIVGTVCMIAAPFYVMTLVDGGHAFDGFDRVLAMLAYFGAIAGALGVWSAEATGCEP